MRDNSIPPTVSIHRMMHRGLYVVFFVVLMPFFAFGQITAFEAKTFQDSAGNELKYRILKPVDYDSTKSYPLVLFLHGAGERGNDNYSQLTWGLSHFAAPKFRKEYPAFVIAPQAPKGQTWSSRLPGEKDSKNHTIPLGSDPSEPMKLTIELLDSMQQTFAIDNRRLYVTGLSMGGFGTFDIIERFPNKFAAAVPICGGGDITKAFLLKDMPIWVFHGAEDQVVSPKFSRSMVSAIQIAGGSPGFTEYPDQGHVGAWVETYSNPHVYEWMFSKQLSEKKARINEVKQQN